MAVLIFRKILFRVSNILNACELSGFFPPFLMIEGTFTFTGRVCMLASRISPKL